MPQMDMKEFNGALKAGNYTIAARLAEEGGNYLTAMVYYAKGGSKEDAHRLVQAAKEGKVSNHEFIYNAPVAQLLDETGLTEDAAELFNYLGRKGNAEHLRRAFSLYNRLGRDRLAETRKEVANYAAQGIANLDIYTVAKMLTEVDTEQQTGAYVLAAIESTLMSGATSDPEYVRQAKKYIDCAFELAGDSEREQFINPHKESIYKLHQALFGE